MQFSSLPRLNNAKNVERRVGVELEFAGVGLARIVEIVARMTGGTPKHVGRFEQRVTGTEHGDYDILMDSRVLHSDGYLEFLSYLGIDSQTPETLRDTEDLLEELAGAMVPYEVVTPPLPASQLPLVDQLCEALRKAGAKGTMESLVYAFGLHLNVEAASLEPDWLLAMLRAYVLLEDWIADEGEVVITRKMSSFIAPYPEEYIRRLLQPNYAPNLRGLMTDYLDHNPTRNRSLDMLPLFCHLDCDVVHSYPVEHHKMKPRPAFHYRLPNCRINEPDWSVATEWNAWVQVERLAEDPDRLNDMAREYLARPGFPGSLFQTSWPDRVRQWLR